ncbi:unnamed protein product [Caretta caretta]
MIFAEYLVLSSLVLGVQLFLHQTRRIQFVEVNDTAKIHCSSTENLKGGGWKVFWYFRREGETPTCIKHCWDDQNQSTFACKHETHSSTLEISTIQKMESGIYYCAYKYSSYLIFGNGSTLIVGAPARECSHYIVPLAAGAGLLLLVVSLSLIWTLCPSTLGFQPRVSAPPASVEPQEQGLTRSLKAKDGSLTLINHISVPMDTWTSGKNFTCEVKFNSSGNSVKKSTRYPAATSTAHASSCLPSIVSLAVLSALMLLMVSLSLIWTLCPSRLGFQPRSSAPPASQENQGQILRSPQAMPSNKNR